MMKLSSQTTNSSRLDKGYHDRDSVWISDLISMDSRGAYFKFRRRHEELIRGRRLIEGRGVGRLFSYSQIVRYDLEITLATD